MTASLWIGIFAVIFHVLVYLLVIRIPLKIGNLQRQLVQGAVIYFVAVGICSLMVNDFSFWHFSAVYYFGCVAYFFTTSVVFTSLSVKTLNMLINRPDQSLPSDEIYQECILSPFEERAEMFINNGAAEKVDNLYNITPAGRRYVERLRSIRKLLGVETTGFYS